MPASRTAAVWILIGLFVIGLLPPGALATHVSAQTQSCPSNMILKGAISEGAPKTLNMFVNPDIIPLGYNLGIMPIISPLGTPDYNSTMTDWVRSSNNYTVWTVNVKPGIKWSDGTPITSADILATYSNKFAFNASYDFTGDHNEVKSEVALNSSAVQFNLTRSDAAFPTVIGEQVLTSVAPAKVINASGSTPDNNLFNTPSSGPWYSVNYVAGDTIMKLLRNPYYTPAPTPCELDMSFPESTSTIASLLLGGTIDFGRLDPVSAKLITNVTNLHVWSEPGNGPIQLNYNTTLYPLNMTAFRQALVYAINDTAVLQQALNGFGSTAFDSEGDVPSQFTNVYNSNQTKYSFNQTKSIELMKSIGLTLGSDGVLRYSNGTAVTLTMWSENDFSTITAAGIIQTDLSQIGINVNLHSCESSCLFAMPSLEGGTVYLSFNGAALYSSPLFDALPCWDVYCVPPLANVNYMYPPNIDSEYYGNLSVVQSTTDPSAVHKAVANIQALAAQYLPLIPIAYGSEIWGYSTARWTNWTPFPYAWMNWGAQNEEAWYSFLKPVGAAGSTNTTTAVSTSSTTSLASSSLSSSPQSLSSSSSLASSASTPISSSSTLSAAGPDYTTIAVAVVIIIIIAAAALFVIRRRPPRGP